MNTQDEHSNTNLTKKKKGLAIASLVLSIIGGYPSASTASLIAVILGHIALYKIKKYPNVYTGKRLAIAGLILGYIGLILAIILGIMRGLVRNKLGY